MHFTLQQTFLVGSALLALPAFAAPIANPTADVLVARSGDAIPGAPIPGAPSTTTTTTTGTGTGLGNSLKTKVLDGVGDAITNSGIPGADLAGKGFDLLKKGGKSTAEKDAAKLGGAGTTPGAGTVGGDTVGGHANANAATIVEKPVDTTHQTGGSNIGSSDGLPASGGQTHVEPANGSVGFSSGGGTGTVTGGGSVPGSGSVPGYTK